MSVRSAWELTRPQTFFSTRNFTAKPMNFIRKTQSLFLAGTSPTQKAAAPKREGDSARYCPGGYHPAAVGDLYKGRYQVKWKLGFGLYSTVWLAQDRCVDRHVALKILTADSYNAEKPVYELEILQHISTVDPNHAGYKHVIHLLDHFIHTGPNGKHLCLVFKVMGESISVLRRRFPTRQIPAVLMHQIARQMLLGLDYLHRSCGVIHTDIKPGNILIDINSDEAEHLIQSHAKQHPENSNAHLKSSNIGSEALALISVDSIRTLNVRIVDFGVASWTTNHLTEWIQPPSLRAPEVTLGIPWDSKVDMWSAACTIFELLQGYLLFNGKQAPSGAWTAEEDQLAQMIELLGHFPPDLLRQGSRSSQFFNEDGHLRNIHQFHPFSLEDKIKLKKNNDLSDDDVKAFSLFLRSLLQYRPNERKDATAAAKDPWLWRKQRK